MSAIEPDGTEPLILRPHGTSPYVFFCDHASNFIPAELNGLGLPAAELARHIAWDIGAAGVTRALSEMFAAPAILCGASRLVIDCNRQLEAPDLIPEMSDGTVIPGNANLSANAREARIRRWFQPYHQAVESVFLSRDGAAARAVSIHSMTESLAGVARPWQIAISSHVDRRLTDVVLAALRAPGDVIVGDNQPYDLNPLVDYSTPYHAMLRGLRHLQGEFRQDKIATAEDQRKWAGRLAQALTHAAAIE